VPPGMINGAPQKKNSFDPVLGTGHGAPAHWLRDDLRLARVELAPRKSLDTRCQTAMLNTEVAYTPSPPAPRVNRAVRRRFSMSNGSRPASHGRSSNTRPHHARQRCADWPRRDSWNELQPIWSVLHAAWPAATASLQALTFPRGVEMLRTLRPLLVILPLLATQAVAQDIPAFDSDAYCDELAGDAGSTAIRRGRAVQDYALDDLETFWPTTSRAIRETCIEQVEEHSYAELARCILRLRRRR
jgi:hypothetical protein